ncbi:hypothetical protein ACP4OV_023565 [Aristida adscensionis]
MAMMKGRALGAAAALLALLLVAASLCADAAAAPRRLLGADHRSVAGGPSPLSPAAAAAAQQKPLLVSVSKEAGPSCGTFDKNISCPPPPVAAVATNRFVFAAYLHGCYDFRDEGV